MSHSIQAAIDLAGGGPRPVKSLADIQMFSEATLSVPAGATSQKVAMTTASAQSTAIAGTVALVTPDATCFVRQGAAPTANSDGTDMLLLANNTYRVLLTSGNKLAFIVASGTGNVYITPGV
jgi:hypothetical protein